MSSTVTVSPAKGVRGIGLVSIIAGIVLIVAGIGTWFVVSDQLSNENITVSEDASFGAGKQVSGPLTAYAQAEVINKHALEASGGKTYAELEQDDPTRQTVMTASFLRASLFTSVVAFGVCALVIGLGIMFLLLGMALRRLAAGPTVAVASGQTSDGDLSDARHAAPERSAPAAPAAAAAAAAPAAAPARTEPVAPAAEPPVRNEALSTPAAEARAAAPAESAAPVTPASPGPEPAAPEVGTTPPATDDGPAPTAKPDQPTT